MRTIREIEKAREAVLAEMRSIRSMRKGCVTRQFLRVKHKDKEEPVLRGPYFVFTRKEGKKTVGFRLRETVAREALQRDVAAHQRFVALCQQFVELTEALGEQERREKDGSMEKKRRRSPSSKTRK